MSKELDKKALGIAQEQVANMLDANWNDICDARNMAAVQASKQGKDKFVYSTTITIKQEPRGDEIVVSSSLSCSVAFKDETDPEMASNQMELDV